MLYSSTYIHVDDPLFLCCAFYSHFSLIEIGSFVTVGTEDILTRDKESPWEEPQTHSTY